MLEEMALWVKLLPNKREDLSLNPRTQVKLDMVARIFNPGALRGKWSSLAIWATSHTYKNQRDPSSNKAEGWRNGSVFKNTGCSFREDLALIPRTHVVTHSHL